ncbi:CBK_G0011320.mRNA.1.CDS.1 [Saccharomyces cerevisiae]|nr:CBK_G0011320.mRNA.1.CDS.1 [Saccharomyces cerevisiae]CAI7214187.1 CBK_G0011320.mRNA.1.CDS.1 [Saccharomyces cerevisiae]
MRRFHVWTLTLNTRIIRVMATIYYEYDLRKGTEKTCDLESNRYEKAFEDESPLILSSVSERFQFLLDLGVKSIEISDDMHTLTMKNNVMSTRLSITD